MHNWARLRQLSGRELSLLARASLSLPLIALGLRLFGFNRVQAALAGRPPAAGGIPIDAGPVLARETARMVRIAAEHGPCRTNCLPRSLALWYLLRCQGLNGELRIGVRKTADLIEAHAWVELDGTPLNDQADVSQRFPAFEQPVIALGTKP